MLAEPLNDNDFAEYGLDELATTVIAEHQFVLKAATTAVNHAIRAGQALMVAKKLVPQGEWERWLETECGLASRTAAQYVRLATYKALIPTHVHHSQTEALLYLRGLPGIDGASNKPYPPETKHEAHRLSTTGLYQRDIAHILGVSKSTIDRWVGQGKKGKGDRRRYREKAARKALRRQERDRAMLKAGGSIGLCYSMIRKTAQALDRAHGEESDREIRLALGVAITKLHQAEDHIVRALGIS